MQTRGDIEVEISRNRSVGERSSCSRSGVVAEASDGADNYSQVVAGARRGRYYGRKTSKNSGGIITSDCALVRDTQHKTTELAVSGTP